MKSRMLLSAVLTIALVALTQVAFPQGPVGDEVKVTFDRAVQVGSHTLPAGDYTVRQVSSASNPRVLEFTSNHGTKLDATVNAIPVLQNTPPTQTKVILDNEGSSPRLSRIWVQGKSYGYEFPGESLSAKQSASAINLRRSIYPCSRQRTNGVGAISQWRPYLLRNPKIQWSPSSAPLRRRWLKFRSHRANRKPCHRPQPRHLRKKPLRPKRRRRLTFQPLLWGGYKSHSWAWQRQVRDSSYSGALIARIRPRMQRFALALVMMGMATAIAGGILGLSAWTGQTAARARWEKERASEDVGAAEALTRLSFPSQGKDFFVGEGATEENLLLGPSHVEWSGMLGAKGNAIIAAHRDTHFRVLKDLKKGELIDVERRGREFHYRIVSLEIVTANDRRFYAPTTVPTLTLVTCYPFYYLGSAPKRFIARAELVESSS